MMLRVQRRNFEKSVLSFTLICGLCLSIGVALAAPTESSDPSCERVLVRIASEAELAEISEKLSPKVESFSQALSSRLLEREYLIELGILSLLSNEHLLLMGPPGNAKSMFADEFMTHIVEEDGKTSYFRLQLTPETTMSETHGPVDWKKLPETGRLERHYDQGMLFSRLVFTDEIFDARANTLRNLLGMYNERAHAQGVEIVKGKIETVFAATNRYISEVYERAGDDGPKAVLDRFTFSSFVPGSFENLESVVSIIQGAKRSGHAIPEISFSELDELRALVPQVEIPDFEAEFLAIFSERFRLETESLEQASLREYRQKQRNGEVEIDPPYRATKYISGRTIGKAAGMLRAIVVRDWLAKGGSRKLEANLSDIQKLKSVFTLNGPSDSYIEMELERATNPHERVQLQTIQQERKIFDRIFDEMSKELNETLYEHAFVELTEKAASREALTQSEQKEFTEELAGRLLDVREQLTSLREQAQTSLEQRESSWSPRRMALEKLEETLFSELQMALGEHRAFELLEERERTREQEVSLSDAQRELRDLNNRITELQKEEQKLNDSILNPIPDVSRDLSPLAIAQSKQSQKIELTFGSKLHTATSPDQSSVLMVEFGVKDAKIHLFKKGAQEPPITFSNHGFERYLGVLNEGGIVSDVFMADHETVYFVLDKPHAIITWNLRKNTISRVSVGNPVSPTLSRPVQSPSDPKTLLFINPAEETIESINPLNSKRTSSKINFSKPELQDNFKREVHLGRYEKIQISADGTQLFFTTREWRHLHRIDLITSTLQDVVYWSSSNHERVGRIEPEGDFFWTVRMSNPIKLIKRKFPDGAVVSEVDTGLSSVTSKSPSNAWGPEAAFFATLDRGVLGVDPDTGQSYGPLLETRPGQSNNGDDVTFDPYWIGNRYFGLAIHRPASGIGKLLGRSKTELILIEAPLRPQSVYREKREQELAVIRPRLEAVQKEIEQLKARRSSLSESKDSEG